MLKWLKIIEKNTNGNKTPSSVNFVKILNYRWVMIIMKKHKGSVIK